MKPSVMPVIRKLKAHYPDAHCALAHKNPFELLIATILSAQCTDERVNQVTPGLFQRFPNPLLMQRADRTEIEKQVQSTGFFRNKAKSIHLASQKLTEFSLKEGREPSCVEVPRTLKDLVSLPGVGRKTANVVLGTAYGIPSGVVVDTHVLRLSNRLGWVRSQNPEVVERQLMQLIPRGDWILLSHLLITHGRRVCLARRPKCEGCFLSKDCPKRGVKLD